MDAERVSIGQSIASGIHAGADYIFRLKEPLKGPDLFASLVAASKSDLKSPERSTVPMLAAWKDFGRALNELGHALNHPIAQAAQLSFEHGVPVVEGRGKSSFTDLMVTTADAAIAVEAKYREPEYATVKSWLAEGRDGVPGAEIGERSNRELVLRGWLTMIAKCTGVTLDQMQVADCTYQLIHRTASVCSLPDRRWRAVVYQHFYDRTEPHNAPFYASQLRRLKVLLGAPNALQFVLLECPFIPSDRFKDLVERKRNGERDLANEVSEALHTGNLFRFESWRTTIA